MGDIILVFFLLVFVIGSLTLLAAVFASFWKYIIPLLLFIVVGCVVYHWYNTSLISPKDLAMDLRLDDDGGGISGNVSNNSKYEVTGLRVKILGYDCPSNNVTDMSQCTGIAQATAYSNVKIPTNQTRLIQFDDGRFDNEATVKGVFEWSFEVTRINGW